MTEGTGGAVRHDEPPPSTAGPSSSAPADVASSRGRSAPSLGDFIRDQRCLARLSLRKLSALSQISNPYLSQIERGLRRPSAEILQQLAKALRISAETLYVQAGMLEARSDTTDLAAAIWADPTLAEAQKRALEQVYRSFQRENRVTVDVGVRVSDGDGGDESDAIREEVAPARR